MTFPKLHVVWSLVALGLLMTAIVAFLERSRANAGATAESSLPLVRTALARRRDVEVTSNVIGTVLPSRQVNIQTQLSGRLIAAKFTEGQFVRRGQVLFQIDARPARAALQLAQATLARDEATLANARRDARRYILLFKENSISSQLRDQALTAAKSDEAIVGADEASVELAKLNVEYTEIRSPINGKTGPIQVQPGNIVYATGGQGANTLVTVTDLQPVKMSFFLPQSDMQLVLAQAKGKSLRISYSVPNSGAANRVAEADFVDSTVDSQSGTVEFRTLIQNKDLALWPGETLNVRVVLKRLENVIVVPREAVNSGPDGDYAYALDRSDKVLRVPLVLLNDDGFFDAVSGSLSADQPVVTEGQFRIAAGLQVSVMSQSARPVPVSDTGDVR
ncbi:MAG TPA: efflux RND transporter periplasmic adaptor subunit [Steroidobacteraceae bacterium]|nr:efflux RND transporter periplasmic adaptor subunit [Steroidobacteraceae bacterium]